MGVMKACLASVVVCICAAGCGVLPERVSSEDPRVRQLTTAMAAVDRASLGFTPIESDAQLRLESRPRAGYDAMLHVAGKTTRTVAFRRRDDHYEWIGEQETFEGPNEYDSPDGRFREAITITFETVHVSGAPLNRVYITYRGDDPHLTESDVRQQLALDTVRPILRKWGYPK